MYCTLVSLCLDIVDIVVVACLYLVKLLLSLSGVLFFLFLVVLPVIVNKDEYIIQKCLTELKFGGR